MKNLQTFFIFAVILLGASTGWAQKKAVVQALTQPVSGALTARPYAELLSKTQAFITANGRRPMAAINNEHGVRIRAAQMTPAQLVEYRLANQISRTLSLFKAGKLAPGDQDLSTLHTLVSAHPNSRAPVHITPYLAKHRALRREEHIADVYTRAIDYITTYGVRPRLSIYDTQKGKKLSLEEIEEKYSDQAAEIRLGIQIRTLLEWDARYGVNHPKINELRKLLSQYRIQSVPNSPRGVLKDLRIFLDKYHRLPRGAIFHNNRTLTQEEESEISLYRRLHNLRYPSNPLSPELEDFAQIKQLVSQYRPPWSEKEVLQQALAWVAVHGNFRPRKLFFRHSKAISLYALPLELFDEAMLFRRMEQTVRHATQPTEEVAALKQILQLPVRPQAETDFPVEVTQESNEDKFWEEYF